MNITGLAIMLTIDIVLILWKLTDIISLLKQINDKLKNNWLKIKLMLILIIDFIGGSNGR